MTSLWSKAAQAHRCRCRAYSTAVAGLGRRVTAAPRRRATFAEIFTACYSSVFASAAIIDAVRKDERRRDLDRQLDEARHELAVLREESDQSLSRAGASPAWLAELEERSKESQVSIESSLAWLSDNQMEELWDSLKRIWLSRPYLKEIDKPAELSISQLRAKLQTEHYNIADLGKMRNLRYANPHFLQYAMVLEESQTSTPRRDPTNHRHLERFSEEVRFLVKQLMERARVSFMLNSRNSPSRSSPSFKEAQQLLDEGYPRYQLRNVDHKAARKTLTQLNHANREALHDKKLSVLESVGRVCYNLLVSTHAPDIHTFNTLIGAFGLKPGLTHFAESIIYVLLHKSYLMPTQTTFAAVLKHERQRGNHGRFLVHIARLVGLDGKTGAKVKARHIDWVRQDPGLHEWALNKKQRTFSGDYVWQHGPLNIFIVEEIIRGLLQFKMFEGAVSFFTSCLQVGVQVGTKLMKLIFDECLCTLDWSASVRLIQQLTKHSETWQSMMRPCDDASAAYLVDRICSILDMIGARPTGQPLSEAALANLGITASGLAELYGKIRETNSSLPPELRVDYQRGSEALSEPTRAATSRLLQLASIEKEYIRVRKTTKSIESKLVNPQLLPLAFTVSTITHVGHQTLEDGRRLNEKILEIFKVVMTPESIEALLDSSKVMQNPVAEPVSGLYQMKFRIRKARHQWRKRELEICGRQSEQSLLKPKQSVRLDRDDWPRQEEQRPLQKQEFLEVFNCQPGGSLLPMPKQSREYPPIPTEVHDNGLRQETF